ncbi:ParB N-terminal domain-containing protein, partial [Planctomonas sp. JC2975]|uniref:ParB/RepB/Spo0J family partition protein n=1 Tax=Planctomonas sp. JC2975 TaxID=2729626 RepID=UPI0014728683
MSSKKNTTEADGPAATVDVSAIAVELIDPAVAVLDANVRTVVDVPLEFIDSIRADGVREPVKARRGEDGTVYIYDGQRRLQAAREAGLAAIPAVFGLAEQGGTVAARITDQLRTFARDELTTLDRVAAVQQLSLEGASVTRIARSTGTSKKRVADILTVAGSATATQAATEYGQQLTL